MDDDLSDTLNALLSADALACEVELVEDAFSDLACEKRMLSVLREDVSAASAVMESRARVFDAVSRIHKKTKVESCRAEQQQALHSARDKLAGAHESSISVRLQKLESLKECAEKSFDHLTKSVRCRLPSSLEETLAGAKNFISSSEIVGNMVDDGVKLFASRTCELCDLLANCTSSRDESQLHVAQRYGSAVKHSRDATFVMNLAQIDQSVLHRHFVNARKYASHPVVRSCNEKPTNFTVQQKLPVAGFLPPAKHVLTFRWGFRFKNELKEFHASHAKLCSVEISDGSSAFHPITSMQDATLAACFLNDHRFCPPFAVDENGAK